VLDRRNRLLVNQSDRVRVLRDEPTGPRIMVAQEQLDDVRALLRRHSVTHTFISDASIVDGQAQSVVQLERFANVERIQEILDGTNS
jgi:hypothetical protein